MIDRDHLHTVFECATCILLDSAWTAPLVGGASRYRPGQSTWSYAMALLVTVTYLQTQRCSPGSSKMNGLAAATGLSGQPTRRVRMLMRSMGPGSQVPASKTTQQTNESDVANRNFRSIRCYGVEPDRVDQAQAADIRDQSPWRSGASADTWWPSLPWHSRHAAGLEALRNSMDTSWPAMAPLRGSHGSGSTTGDMQHRPLSPLQTPSGRQVLEPLRQEAC